MTDLMPFSYEGRQVRTVLVNGEPWFVAADIAAVLGLGRQQDSTRYLDDDERGVCLVDTPSGQQEMVTVNEPGLFSLILRSRKPEAKVFTRWVTHEVLPAIRREGGYISPAATADQLTLLAARAEVQTRVLRNLSGIVDRDWLEAKARHVAARALGEEPEIDPDRRPLTVGEYLEERGIGGVMLRKMSPKFGKRLKAAYVSEYGHAPTVVDRFVDGAVRSVAVYSERHRPLFDQIWNDLR
jgi:prophage antirepressor-like protein